jgi:hypothetical protein
MARVLTTTKSLTTPQKVNIGAGTADFVPLAADASLKNYVVYNEKLILIVYNPVGGSTYTVTVDGVADELGRTGSITTYSLAAGDFVILGPFPSEVFKQADGTITFEASNNAVLFAAIVLP